MDNTEKRVTVLLRQKHEQAKHLQESIENLTEQLATTNAQIAVLEQLANGEPKLLGEPIPISEMTDEQRADCEAIAKTVPNVPVFNVTKAVCDIVTKHGNAPGLLVPEIQAHLAKRGRQTEYATIYSYCRRLVRRGKILEGKRDGVKSFMRKQPF